MTTRGGGVTDPETRRGWGDLVQAIVAVLEQAAPPMTPAQVRHALGGGMAYTTTMTVLARLYDKGIVSREPAGRAFAYRLIGDPALVTARRMHRLLDVEPDRAYVLAHFIGGLRGEDEALLRRLLDQDSQTSGAPARGQP